MRIRLVYISLFLIATAVLKAQEADVHPLDEVLVFGHFSPDQQSGYRLIVLSDSLANNSLNDLLKTKTNLYIKEHGNGMIASLSLRGSSAAHTAVYWNGIPINSSLNGQTDFNTLFAASVNKISIRKGGGSVVLGSGAIAGAINLENELFYNNKLSGKFNVGIGSYHSYSSSVGLHKATKKSIVEIALNTYNSKNDYPYNQTELYNKNGEIKHYTFQLNGGLLLDKQNEIYLKTSYNTADRNTSGTLYTTNNAQLIYQTHIALLGWKSKGHSYKSKLKTAYFRENYQYVFNKDFPKLASINKSDKWITNWGVNYKISNKIRIQNAVNFELLHGSGTDIINIYRKSMAWVGSLNHQLSNKLFYNINLRKEWISDYKIPFVFSVDSKQKWNAQHTTKINFSTNYRTPTLNDLYWQPGGNTDLLPEKNWSAELGYEYSIHSDHIQFQTSFYVFNSDSSDLIQWVPQSGQMWSPINIKHVISKGLEFDFDLSNQINFHHIEYGIHYSYTRSTDQKTQKQLIYTPKHTGSLTTKYLYKNWSINLDQHYTGKVFTTATNSSSLDSFLLTDLSINKYIMNKKFYLSLKFANLFNVAYEMTPSRPMPNRNYQFNINYKF